ncbi:MAG: stage II sporulation protein M [Candidatus Methanofastidiosia archaeon]
MTYIIILFAIASLGTAYVAGSFLWKKTISEDSYYFNMLFFAFATIFLVFLLAVATMASDTNKLFGMRLAIDSLQSIVAILLFITVYKKTRWEEIKAMVLKDRIFITLALLLFVSGIVLGVTLKEEAAHLVEQSVEEIENLSDIATGKAPWQLGIILFGNNTRTALSLSLALPLIPIIGACYIMFSMILNGAIIGVVGEIIDKPFTYVLAGILPHGIFEVPAILLAAGIGLKLNFYIVKSFIDVLKDRKKQLSAIFKENLKTGTESWKLLYLVILLLLAAAIVESTITSIILSKMV